MCLAFLFGRRGVIDANLMLRFFGTERSILHFAKLLEKDEIPVD